MTSTGEESFKETVIVLINALNDKESSVNNEVIKSLSKIANVRPNELIQIFCDFYKSTAKVNSNHLGNIIKVLEQTCVYQVKKLNPDVVKELVNAMLRAMTQNAEQDTVVQMGASSVLVAIGHMNLDVVLRALIDETSPSSVPHYTIPHTLGTLAAAATYGTVPHIKEILSKMLPLLPLVKSDIVKQSFAYAFGQFAVAVSEQIGDNVESDNITGIKENFVVEFTIIFDVLYNQWLNSHEPKVIEAVLEALGPITRLISERKFDEILNKFVLTLLALYKRSYVNSYSISQCIAYLLSPSLLNPKLALTDSVITAINHVLFTLVLIEPDYDKPHTIKNHFEVLRCFDHMAGQFPDPTIDSLLHQCKNNQEKERMRAVIVLTHLTTSSQMFIDKYSSKFMGILKVMTTMEHNIKMKKLIVKAIVGLVYRNCIVNTEDFTMVEFIVKHCGYEATANQNKDEAFDLQDTCRSSLILLCNTVTSVRPQLRNLLLTSITLDDYSSSISTVTGCLISLLQNNSEDNVENNEKIVAPDVSTELIFVRCLIYLVDPDKTDRNKNILVFLEEYSEDIHKNLKNSWTVEIQRLLKFVERNESKEQWHAMLLDLLVNAIEEVNNNKWTENISIALSNQILNVKQAPMIKSMSLQYLAIVSCHLTNAAIVENVLKIILFSLKSIPMESCEFVGKAVGIASRQHGEYVLNELDAIYKEVESKRSNRILNFMTSRNSKIHEYNVIKYAVITCYGKIAEQCLDVHVLARLGENVTNILYETLKSNPQMDLCKASITALYHITKALQPASHHNLVLRNRWQLLNSVLEQIFNPNLDKRNVELYPIIVKASKALTKLQKGILPEERNTILKVLFNSIFGELATFKKKYESEGNGKQNDLLAKTLNDSLTLLHELIRELIIQSTCLSTIDDLVSLLIEWLHHENDEVRVATVLIIYVIFDAYIKNVKLNYETPSKFGQMGFLLGLISPGIADTNFSVRLSTVDCIKLIIQIQDLYEGVTVEPDDACMKSLTTFHNSILTNDLEMISEYSKSLCQFIFKKIPLNYQMQFIESLIESFNDFEFRSTSIGAMLDAFFVEGGTNLYQNVERILEIILGAMDSVSENIGVKLLPSIKSLARHHCNAVTAVLLAQRLPLKGGVILTWRYLACDDQLSLIIVENFLRLITSIELFEDPYHITDNHVAALQPLTLISALGEMLQEEQMSHVCKLKFAELFAVLFTTLASYCDAAPPAYSIPVSKTQERIGFVPNRDAVRLSPAKISLNTLNLFLLRADCRKVKEACSLCLSIEHGDSSSNILELVPVLSGALCRECPQYVARVVTSLAPFARSNLPPHRSCVLAFYGDLLNYSCSDVLIETIVTSLSAGCADKVSRVRATSLRGMANVARMSGRIRDTYLPGALHALSQGVDAHTQGSPIDNVPLAAIQGLSRLVSELGDLDGECGRELLSLSQKIRPFMNTDCSQLREYSIRLYGILANKVKPDSLVDQSVSCLPCFLLHLCDSTPAVVRASKFTLKQVFRTFKASQASELVATHLPDEGRLVVTEFLPALLRGLARDVPHIFCTLIDSAANYLNTTREDLKPYAPLLIGSLLSELTSARHDDPNIPTCSDDVLRSIRLSLLSLLRDTHPLTRQHVASALAALCLYNTSPIA